MDARSEADLRALLPAGIETVDVAGLSIEVRDQGPEERALAKRIRRPKGDVGQRLYCLPAIPGVHCENRAHTLLSRVNEAGDIEFFSGDLALQSARGLMPARFVYFDSWRTNAAPRFVCPFCAASLEECWREAEAEAAAS